MRFFRLLHPQWRLLLFGMAAVGFQVLLALVSPVQAPVVPYKLALVTLAAILGMFFDVAAFPFAAPPSYPDDDWKRAPGGAQRHPADFPIANKRRLPFVAVFVAAVSVGL